MQVPAGWSVDETRAHAFRHLHRMLVFLMPTPWWLTGEDTGYSIFDRRGGLLAHASASEEVRSLIGRVNIARFEGISGSQFDIILFALVAFTENLADGPDGFSWTIEPGSNAMAFTIRARDGVVTLASNVLEHVAHFIDNRARELHTLWLDGNLELGGEPE